MAAGDLTDLNSVRLFMQKGTAGANTEQDALINALIPAASRVILQWTGREFAPASTAVTRTFTYDGSGLLDLVPYDLRTITAISRDPAGTPAALTAPTDYVLQPVNPADGVYTHLRFSSLFWRSYPSSTDRSIAITGNWGFASVPADVQYACNMTIKWWITNDVSAFSSGLDVNTDQFTRGRSLPEGVRDMLSPYRRIAIG